MTERLKIEDMTLGQIKDLKKTLSQNISEAINQLVDAFNNKFDCGDVDVSVRTDVYEEEFNCFGPLKAVMFKTSIKFSKEEEL